MEYLHIFTHIWAVFGVNVGKYSSTMEHLGMVLYDNRRGSLQVRPRGGLRRVRRHCLVSSPTYS